MNSVYFPLTALFLLSGAVGLVYQVLWSRLFTFILGSTLEGVTVVVATFLGGLALGAMIIGRIVERHRNPLLLYAKLETGGAAMAALIFVVFAAREQWADSVFSESLLLWGALLPLLLLSTACLGGTLPCLVKYLPPAEKGGTSSLPYFYAIHTLGAAGGSIAAGFVLIPYLGYLSSAALAVSVHLVLALVAASLCQQPLIRESVEASSQAVLLARSECRIALRPLGLACFLCGFVGLGLELVWFRLAEFAFYGTIRGFALLMFAYLLGHGVGAFLVRRDTLNEDSLPGQIVKLVAVFTALLVSFLPGLALVAGASSTATGGALLVIVIFVTTAVSGAFLPLIFGFASDRFEDRALRLGILYGCNSLGCVCGAVVAGLILIPTLGTVLTILILTLLSLLTLLLCAHSLGLQLTRFHWLVLSASSVVLCTNLLSRDWLAALHGGASRESFPTAARDSTIIATRESKLAILHVREGSDGERTLTSGPFTSGSSQFLRRYTQVHQGHLPMLLHPQPLSVLQIGYGVGEITRALLDYDLAKLTLVEIDEKMIPFADRFFKRLNRNASSDSRVQIVIEDGRRFLRQQRELFDVIMTDTMEPISEGSLRLYSREHFRAGRERLKPGGFMVLWFPLYAGGSRSESVIRSFLEEFPHSLIWFSTINLEIYLFGFRDAPTAVEPSFQSRFQEYGAAPLSSFGYRSAEGLLAGFSQTEELREILAKSGAPHNTDLVPILDFLPKDSPAPLIESILALAPLYPSSVRYREAERTLWKLMKQGGTADSGSLFIPPRAQDRTELLALRETAPNHPVVNLLLANTYLRRSDLGVPQRAAETDLQDSKEALSFDPFSAWANLRLSRQALGENRCSEAEQYLTRAEARSPYWVEILHLRRDLTKNDGHFCVNN